MARFEQIVDLYWTEAGDLALSQQGDLRDTKTDAYRGFVQRIDTRVSSARGDWKTELQMGAGLTDFVGKRNTPELAKAIRQRIYNELYQEDLLRASEVSVDVIPISGSKLAIAVIVKPPNATGQITRLYSYSLTDNKIYLRSI